MLPDLIVTNQAGNSVSVFPNQGDRGFGSSVEMGVGRLPVAAIAADFDGDGRYDLAIGGDGVLVANNTSVGHAARADGNGDGRISAADLVTLARQLDSGPGSRVEDLRRRDPSATTGVDANGDGRVDTLDAAATIFRLFRDTGAT